MSEFILSRLSALVNSKTRNLRSRTANFRSLSRQNNYKLQRYIRTIYLTIQLKKQHSEKLKSNLEKYQHQLNNLDQISKETTTSIDILQSQIPSNIEDINYIKTITSDILGSVTDRIKNLESSLLSINNSIDNIQQNGTSEDKPQKKSNQKRKSVFSRIIDFVKNNINPIKKYANPIGAGVGLAAQGVKSGYDYLNGSNKTKSGGMSDATRMPFTDTKGGTVDPGSISSSGAYKRIVNVPFVQGGKRIPASVRYNNPGAAYPRKRDEQFGIQGYGIIGGGHKIGKYPTIVHGLASNMDLFAKNYKGMSLSAATTKWRGRPGTPLPEGLGLGGNDVITEEMVKDRAFMMRLFSEFSKHEAGRNKSQITSEQMDQSFKMYQSGGIEQFKKDYPDFKPTEISERPEQSTPLRISKEDIKNRPYHMTGSITLPKLTDPETGEKYAPPVFPTGSGGGKGASIPLGIHPMSETRQSGPVITNFAGKSKVVHIGRKGTDYQRISDPKLGRDRTAIQIHSTSDIERLVSAGCIVIPKSQYKSFMKYYEKALKEHGQLYMMVSPTKKNQPQNFIIITQKEYNALRDKNKNQPLTPAQASSNFRGTGDVKNPPPKENKNKDKPPELKAPKTPNANDKNDKHLNNIKEALAELKSPPPGPAVPSGPGGPPTKPHHSSLTRPKPKPYGRESLIKPKPKPSGRESLIRPTPPINPDHHMGDT